MQQFQRPKSPEPIDPLEAPLVSKIQVPEEIPKNQTVQEHLMREEPVDVVALAKVDVRTYTQRLIDDLKKHEDDYRKS